MNVSTLMALVASVGLLGIAVCGDWRSRRISNSLLAAAWVVALGWQAWAPAGLHFLHPQLPGAQGVGASFASTALMLCLTFLLWQRRVFGAGDAKLLSILAAYSGPLLVVPLLALTLMAGGVLAMCSLVIPAQRERLWGVLCGDFSSAQEQALSAQPLPYAVAIAIGTLALYAGVGYGLLPIWWF